MFFFFFSSRRRHTRCLSDWSSDVCSSDLTEHVAIMARGRIAAVGTIARIRELLDEQPLSVRVDSDEPRRLAQEVLTFDEVVGIELPGGDTLIVKARTPRAFFTLFARLVIEGGHEVHRMEPLDDSAEAVLNYLLAGSH